MLDKKIQTKLNSKFWDKTIINHFKKFADLMIYSVDKKLSKITGIASCMINKNTLEVFLFAVHPNYQSEGIGKNLLEYVKNYCVNKNLKLVTNVLLSNNKAINFYLKNNFFFHSSEVTLHFWRDFND